MPGVFVLDRDGDLSVFASVPAAAAWMEAIDVEDGEYESAFLHDGTVMHIATEGQAVVLTAMEARDLPRLERQLAKHQRFLSDAPSTADPLVFANEWLRRDWERRWPRHPAWLARRLHGDAPPQVRDQG